MRPLVGTLIVALAVTACDKNSAPVPVPMPIATPTINENYTGTLSPSGSNLHFFQVQQASQVLVTLTQLVTVPVAANPAANPPVVAIPATPLTVPLEIHVGQQILTTIGVQCSKLKSVMAPAGSSPQLTGQAITGTYCVAISDPNNVLPRASMYAITVAHS
jgi:hypothetical protein